MVANRAMRGIGRLLGPLEPHDHRRRARERPPPPDPRVLSNLHRRPASPTRGAEHARDDRMRHAGAPETCAQAMNTRFWRNVLTAGAWRLRGEQPVAAVLVWLLPLSRELIGAGLVADALAVAGVVTHVAMHSAWYGADAAAVHGAVAAVVAFGVCGGRGRPLQTAALTELCSGVARRCVDVEGRRSGRWRARGRAWLLYDLAGGATMAAAAGLLGQC